MSENHLPKDIGKKIADALKNENIQSVNESIAAFAEPEAVPEVEELETTPEVEEETAPQADDKIYESTSFGVDFDDVNFDEPTLDETNFDDIMKETPKYKSVFAHSDEEEEETESVPELKLSIDLEDEEEDYEMPHNIQVLKRLIAQLPTGVPKQTGAQIIRQTIEALGIPMKSVLQDAQKVRECLSSSIKDCSFTIQEYRNNIRNLEKQSANYQKQLAKLNDVIGLFVYNKK